MKKINDLFGNMPRLVKSGVMTIKTEVIRFGNLIGDLDKINKKAKKLNIEKVKKIDKLLISGVPQHKVANEFGITQQMVSKIKKKDNWKRVPRSREKVKRLYKGNKHKDLVPKINYLLSQGKSEWDIAKELDIKLATVRMVSE